MGAITFCNPVDVVKTRLQLQQKTPSMTQPRYSGVSGTLRVIAVGEGVRGLQKGLSAVYLLQFSNVGVRFGGYGFFKRLFGLDNEDSSGSKRNAMLFASGAASGALAAIVSNPFYLLKTRLQADTRKDNPLTLRQAVRSLVQEEGVKGFWGGIRAFIPRTAAASAVQLSVYDVVKPWVMSGLNIADGLRVCIVSSFITGVAVVAAMQPFDFTATRMMNSPKEFPTFTSCMVQTYKNEGPRAFYQGTLANYLRFGPYCVLVFVFTEQLRELYSARLM